MLLVVVIQQKRSQGPHRRRSTPKRLSQSLRAVAAIADQMTRRRHQRRAQSRQLLMDLPNQTTPLREYQIQEQLSHKV